jgi:hypothetical protein
MAEPKEDITKQDILDQLILLYEDIRASFRSINRRLDNLEARIAPAPTAPIDEEAPSDEPSCEEQFYDDELSIDEPSDDDCSQIDELCEELIQDASSCQIEPPCKPAYERSIKPSIRHQNKPSNRMQLELPSFKSPQADDVADTPGDSIIQGVIVTVDGLSLLSWHRDVFTCVDR